MTTSDRFLLDTNVVIRALRQPASLSLRVRKAIVDGPNVLSVIVYWEIVLKVMKGSVVVGHPRTWWPDALDMLAATALSIEPAHIDQVSDLPAIHKDPFDRLLITQALAEGCTLVAMDVEMHKYKSKRLRVIG